MLQMGVIRECERAYAFNCVVIFKKKRFARMCIDYRQLSAITTKDCYHMCDIQTLLDCLYEACLFTSLDLHNGYYQVDVAPHDQHKTAFLVPSGGLYCFLRMPFGLCNALATFTRIMSRV